MGSTINRNKQCPNYFKFGCFYVFLYAHTFSDGSVCTHAYSSQGTSGVFLDCSPLYFLKHYLSVNLGLTVSQTGWSPEVCVPPAPSPVQGLQILTMVPSFYWVLAGLSLYSSLEAYIANLLTELFPQAIVILI